MKLWTAKDIAEFFGVALRTAYDYINRPDFPRAIAIGGRRWVDEEVKRWALRQRSA